MSANKLIYIELPATSTDAMKAFYGTLFGWSFQDYGPEYSAFSNAGVEGGFHAGHDRTKAPLPVIETDDIEAAEQRVVRAGGRILVPTFAFPGGRRFQFEDPGGNEMAVMQADTA